MTDAILFRIIFLFTALIGVFIAVWFIGFNYNGTLSALVPVFDESRQIQISQIVDSCGSTDGSMMDNIFMGILITSLLGGTYLAYTVRNVAEVSLYSTIRNLLPSFFFVLFI